MAHMVPYREGINELWLHTYAINEIIRHKCSENKEPNPSYSFLHVLGWDPPSNQ